MKLGKHITILLRWLRKIPFLNKMLFKLCILYIDEYRFFSYDPTLNGEYNILRHLKSILPSKCIIFDVGANVGNWSLVTLNQFTHANIYAFELSEETFSTLKTNLGDFSNIHINNIALSNTNSVIEYIDYGANSEVNTLVLTASYHKRTHNIKSTNSMTGDEYCKKNNIMHIDFLKVDTEGADFFVFDGFNEMLSNHKISIIQFEYGYTHADSKTLMKDFFQFFNERGYFIGRLTPKGVVFKDFEYTDNDFKSGPNYIACLEVFKEKLVTFTL